MRSNVKYNPVPVEKLFRAMAIPRTAVVVKVPRCEARVQNPERDHAMIGRVCLGEPRLI